MATENLKFKIQLYATFWNKLPTCEIFIDDKSHWKGEIAGTEQEPITVEFESVLEQNKEYKLSIHRQGKDKGQTVVNDKGDILKDQLLNIKSIEIDNIDIGALVYEGVYTPEYPEPWATQQRQQGMELPETFKNTTQMGHNGTWTFKFTSPFYMWLLENLY